MTIDKLREILSYYPADANVIIKDRYGDDVKTKDLKIISEIENEVIKKIYTYVLTGNNQPGREPGYTHGAF